MAKTVGEQLRELRIKYGYTQKELAKIVSVTPQAVSLWEKDKNLPDVYVLHHLAELYDVSLDFLLLKEERVLSIRRKQIWMRVYRYVFAPVFLYILSLGISVFVNYDLVDFSIYFFATVLWMMFMLFTYLVVTKRKRLIGFGVSGLLLFIMSVLYFSNPTDYNRERVAYSQIYERVPTSFNLEGEPRILHTDDHENIYIVATSLESQEIYVYRINDFEMEEMIVTTDYGIEDIIVFGDKVYFTSFSDETQEFKLYQMMIDMLEPEVVFEDQSNFRLQLGLGELIMYSIDRKEVDTPDIATTFYMFADEELLPLGYLPFYVDEMYSDGMNWIMYGGTLSEHNRIEYSLYRVDDTFEYYEQVFDEYTVNIPRLYRTHAGVAALQDDEIIFYENGDIIESGIQAEYLAVNNIAGNYYMIINGDLYNYKLELVNADPFVDEEYYPMPYITSFENYFNEEKIGFVPGELYYLEPLARERNEYGVSVVWRFVYLGVSIMGMGPVVATTMRSTRDKQPILPKPPKHPSEKKQQANKSKIFNNYTIE